MRRLLERFGSLADALFIFDKDGTLIDTETLFYEAFDRQLQRYGCRHDPATHARMMGASRLTCMRILQTRHDALPRGTDAAESLGDDLDAFLDAVRSERGTVPRPGAEALLRMCRDGGIRMAMATSSRRSSTERDLDTLGWHGYFEAVVTSDDVTRHKPAPDAFLEAARRMNADPRKCIAFEDGLRGVQSACAAGMFTVFVRDPRFGIDPPEGASLTLASLEELLS